MVKRLATLFLLSLCCVSLSAQENQDYQFALGLFKDGMYELAAAELRKVISQLPEEEKEKPRYYLAETLFRLNKSDEALLEWKSLVDGKNLDIREKSLLRFADSHYSLKHYAEAITAYTDYLARYPAGEGREDALLFLSEAAYKKGDSAKALSRLKEYLKKFPQGKYADYVNFLGGKIAFSQGSYQESRDFLKKLKPGSSLEQEGKFILGTTLLKLNRYEEARSTFKELAEKFKGSDFEVRSLLRMGDSYFREKKYDAAREQYKKIKQLTKNKGHLSEALYLTAETYYDQGLWNQAYLNYDQAVTGFPESDFLEPSLFNMAWCWLKQDDYHRARKDFAKLVLKFPESAYTARTLFLLGHSYYMTQEYDQASEYYTRLLKAYPSDKYIPEAYYWLAETEYRRGKYARVGELAGTFLKKFPRHSLKKDIIIVAGEAALKGNEFQKALGFYGQLDKILSSKEKYIYYFYLGNAYFKKGSWPEAEKYLSLVAKEFPGSPLTAAALLNLGHLYLNRKEYDRSLQTYARIFELFPDDVMGREKAAYYTANVFYKKRSFAEAVTAFLDFEAKFHDSSLVPEGLFYAGWSYFQDGRYAEARGVWKRVLEEYPGTAHREEVILKIADTYFNSESFREAALYYRIIISSYPASSYLAESYYFSGLSFRRAGEERVGEDLWHILVQRFPGSSYSYTALIEMGTSYFQKKNYTYAVSLFEQAHRLAVKGEEKEKAVYWLGYTQLKGEEYPESRKWFSMLLSTKTVSSYQAEATFRIGESYMEEKNYPEAVLYFRKMKDYFPDSELLPQGIYLMYRSMEKLSSREKDSVKEELLKQFPLSSFAGRIYFEEGKKKEEEKRPLEAAGYYEKVVKVLHDDTGAEAQKRLGDIFLAQNDPERARIEYLKVVYVYPDYKEQAAAALYGVADIFKREGKEKEWSDSLRKIIEKYPETVWRIKAEERLSGK